MVPEKKRKLQHTLTFLSCMLLAAAAIMLHYLRDPWGFYWKVPEEEAALRTLVVQTAESYLGCREADASHQGIIDLYNSHTPLAMDYTVQYTDSWCAAFVSAVSIQCGLTEIIPTECGCERQIELFRSLGCWEETDSTTPQPGDLIYFDWDMDKAGECTGWADHVGIVVGTKWPFIKVIEGNLNDSVGYHCLLLDNVQIRGFAKPDYEGFLNDKTP